MTNSLKNKKDLLRDHQRYTAHAPHLPKKIPPEKKQLAHHALPAHKLPLKFSSFGCSQCENVTLCITQWVFASKYITLF